MRPIPQKLYRFLSACGGNWRSTIHIKTVEGDILMAMDRDSQPVFLMPVHFGNSLESGLIPGSAADGLPRTNFRTSLPSI